jgi:2-amino-4-hydroxy-6-hydroxymethyldihydropteridine diphosphokinase
MGTRGVLSLGSNTGEREWNVLEAARLIGSFRGIDALALSSLYETEPMGKGFTRPFVNAIMLIDTQLSPGELLGVCMEIEDETGRDREGGRGDRPLDIDIVLYGKIEMRSDRLTIPHPRMHQRLFVLIPLAELDPDIAVPPHGGTILEIISSLKGGNWVRRISSRVINR